jgi:hypothetical protein
MSEFDAILAIGATTVLLLGAVSGYVRNRLWISEPAICLAVGLALSPPEFELLGPTPGSDEYLRLVQQVARVTLAISIMAELRLLGFVRVSPPLGFVRRPGRPRRDRPEGSMLDGNSTPFLPMWPPRSGPVPTAAEPSRTDRSYATPNPGEIGYGAATRDVEGDDDNVHRLYRVRRAHPTIRRNGARRTRRTHLNDRRSALGRPPASVSRSAP